MRFRGSGRVSLILCLRRFQGIVGVLKGAVLTLNVLIAPFRTWPAVPNAPFTALARQA